MAKGEVLKEGGFCRRPKSLRGKEKPPGEGYQPRDPPQTNQNTNLRETREISGVRAGEDSDYSHADFPEVRIVEMSNLDIMDSDYSTEFFN